MKIYLFEEFNSLSCLCRKCGEEYWGDEEYCDDCMDSDLQTDVTEETPESSTTKRNLPTFEIPTTRSQNIYYL